MSIAAHRCLSSSQRASHQNPCPLLHLVVHPRPSPQIPTCQPPHRADRHTLIHQSSQHIFTITPLHISAIMSLHISIINSPFRVTCYIPCISYSMLYPVHFPVTCCIPCIFLLSFSRCIFTLPFSRCRFPAAYFYHLHLLRIYFSLFLILL